MTLSVRAVPLDRASADESELRGVFEVMAAANRVDSPDLPQVTFESAVARLDNPQPNITPVRRWTARRGDRVVALASLYFPPAENSFLGLLELVVLPDVRRSGVGSGLLRAIAPALREDGRTQLECWNVRQGGPGERFGQALGFRAVCTTVFQKLPLAQVDRASPAVVPADGYRLRDWSGSAPAELVESYAHARRAIADSPFGRSAFRFPTWTVERVRESEEENRRANIGHRVFAAVHEATGQVVGFTEMNLFPHREDVAFQGDTAVLAEHRGHGLGHCVKANMLRWLLAEHPRFEQVFTATSAANPHMIAVNHRLGYHDAQANLVLGQDVDDLLARSKHTLIPPRPAAP